MNNPKFEPTEIICVYDANGNLSGKITYLFKKYFTNYVCPMCDITHNKILEKKEWKNNVKKLKYYISALHINEQTNDMKRFTNNITPCVVGIYAGKKKLLMSKEELIFVNGNVDLFFKRLEEKI